MAAMRFWSRQRSSAEPDAAPAPEAGGFAVVDPLGTAFDAMRASGLGVGMYRVATQEEIAHLGGDSVVLVAAYDARELEAAAPTIARHPTVVLGMGLSEHYGSRALSLGALGFMHDGLSASAVKERFSDALARHRYRRLRTGALASA